MNCCQHEKASHFLEAHWVGVTLTVGLMGAVAFFVTGREKWLLGILPYVFFLMCPFIHLFIMGHARVKPPDHPAGKLPGFH